MDLETSCQETSVVTRKQYLDEVLALYLSAPDTPARPRPADWAITTTFYQERIPLSKYRLRPPALCSLAAAPAVGGSAARAICSLAYLRPMLRHLPTIPQVRHPLDIYLRRSDAFRPNPRPMGAWRSIPCQRLSQTAGFRRRPAVFCRASISLR